MSGFASDPRGTYLLRQSGLPSDFLHRLTGLPIRIMDRLLTWQDRAAERAHLASLDDHRLKDIGITRAQANFEARKPFWRA
ncbi:MAG: DUF1127 domain-containing protein [Kiloniellales bacterium]|nr:DUF1127 domain-containing protein [Kiloniellales bacterium]